MTISDKDEKNIKLVAIKSTSVEEGINTKTTPQDSYMIPTTRTFFANLIFI